MERVLTGINITIMAFFSVVSIYCLVLFIKLAQKALKALDIYIRKNGGL